MHNEVDIASALERVPLLASLSEQEKRALIGVLDYVQVPAGRFLVHQGGSDHDLIILVEGSARVCRADEQGKEMILALLSSGDFFGEIALLTNTARSADVIAELPCTLLSLSRADFQKHVTSFAGLSTEMLKAMARRLALASDRIVNLGLYDVCCRIARILLSIADKQDSDEGEGFLVNPRPTQQAMASMAGCSREAVSRALRTLEADGHILIDEDRLFVYSLP